MYIYGIKIYCHFTTNECLSQAAMEALGNLHLKEGASDILTAFAAGAYGSYSAYLQDNPNCKKPFNEWVENYEDDCGNYGFAAFLTDLIKAETGIRISCDYTTDGNIAVGIKLLPPWSYEKKLKAMKKRDFIKTLTDFTSRFTDEIFSLGYHCCCE